MAEAPGSLYTAGAGLLEASGGQASNIVKQKQAATDSTIQAGDAAASQVGAKDRQMSAQEATMRLKQMEMQENQIKITPQLALGLVKNTGDKSWLEAVGSSMRADVYTGLYTHGMSLANAKKAPRITQVYDKDGKIRHAVVYTDEDGTIQQHVIDEGMTPEKLHPPRGGGSGDKDPNFKKNQQFIKSFENARKEISDPIKAKEMQQLNPDDYSSKVQWLKDNQDQYDQLVKGMGKAGTGVSNAPAGGAGAPNSAPFDADAFINDALKH